MGRKRTKVELSQSQQDEIRRQIRVAGDVRQQERLRFVLLAATGRYTLDGLASRLGHCRSTIQNWLAKWTTGGLAGLLTRDTPPGMTSPLARPAIQLQLKRGLETGRWASAGHVAQWLSQAHGIKRERKSIYYWLQKNGWEAPASRAKGDSTRN